MGVDEGTEPSSVPNEPYQEETPPVIPNDVDIRVNDHHVPAITGYIEVTMPEPEEDDEYEDEEDEDATVAEKRIDEAHDIIHRVAAILAMEEGRDNEPLAEVAWNGKLDGETIELKEDEVE